MLVNVYAKITDGKHSENVVIALLGENTISTCRATRDNEGPYFCINQNKNIDNDLNCSSNEFSDRLLY